MWTVTAQDYVTVFESNNGEKVVQVPPLISEALVADGWTPPTVPED